MIQVTATGSGGSTSYGVDNEGVDTAGGSPTMTLVTATASGASNNNYGVYNIDASPTMSQVTATASGASSNNYGVYNDVGVTPTMSHITASASGGTFNYGAYNASMTTAPRIAHSSLSGSTNGMRFAGSTGTRIANTQISGGIDADPGGVQCRDTYDENLADVIC